MAWLDLDCNKTNRSDSLIHSNGSRILFLPLKCLSSDQQKSDAFGLLQAANSGSHQASSQQPDNQHFFQEYTFKKIASCDVCKDFLRGKRNSHHNASYPYYRELLLIQSTLSLCSMVLTQMCIRPNIFRPYAAGSEMQIMQNQLP